MRALEAMEKFTEILQKSLLFAGIEKDNLINMLQCLSAKVKTYAKNEIILLHGDPITWVGIVIRGNIQLINEDIHGNRTILSSCFPSDIFGEAFACAQLASSPISIEAKEECEIVFCDYKKIISQCTNACPFHTKVIHNMLYILANKNIQLNEKVEILAQRSTRNKILHFLHTTIQKENNKKPKSIHEKKCTIIYNRQELANLLCVERSAMSNELSKMQSDGILLVNKNTFTIL